MTGSNSNAHRCVPVKVPPNSRLPQALATRCTTSGAPCRSLQIDRPQIVRIIPLQLFKFFSVTGTRTSSTPSLVFPRDNRTCGCLIVLRFSSPKLRPSRKLRPSLCFNILFILPDSRISLASQDIPNSVHLLRLQLFFRVLQKPVAQDGSGETIETLHDVEKCTD